jgi:hypothetical protein
VATRARIGVLASITHVGLHGVSHRSLHARRHLDSVLVEDIDRAPTHAAREDDMGAEFPKERRNGSWGVTLVVGVRHDLVDEDLLAVDIDHREGGTVPEVCADMAVQPLRVVTGDDDPLDTFRHWFHSSSFLGP